MMQEFAVHCCMSDPKKEIISKALKFKNDAVAALESGKGEEGLDLITQAIETSADPATSEKIVDNLSDYYRIRAEINVKLEKFENAITDATESIALSPSASAYAVRSTANAALDKRDEAEADDALVRKYACIELAEGFKNEGNELFKAQNFEAASDFYTKAIDACLDEETGDVFEDNIHVYYSNRAFCKLKQEYFGSCIMDASEAIKVKPNFAKAYFRRGSAQEALGKLKLAKEDFTRAVKLEPSNKEADQRLKVVEKILKQQRFLAAIAADEIKSALETVDLNAMVIPSSYSGPVYESGKSGLDFCLALKKHFEAGKQLPEKFAYSLVVDAWRSFKDLPNVVEVTVEKEGKFTMCGDVHGQYVDFLEIFEKNGIPSKENPYLFNGDVVDRGNKSLECLLLMMAFRVCVPGSLYLNRGNHETKSMNSLYGFSTECSQKVNARFYEVCCELFQAIPLAHILNGRVFITHGGLFANDNVKIADIQKVNRFDEPGSEGLFVDLLWADPTDLPGRVPSPRGVGMKFGPNVTENFLKTNNLTHVLRSHEMEQEGYKSYHSGQLHTVFSAPNYCGMMGNKGAYCVMRCTSLSEEKATHPQFAPRGGELTLTFEQFFWKGYKPGDRLGPQGGAGGGGMGGLAGLGGFAGLRQLLANRGN